MIHEGWSWRKPIIIHRMLLTRTKMKVAGAILPLQINNCGFLELISRLCKVILTTTLLYFNNSEVMPNIVLCVPSLP